MLAEGTLFGRYRIEKLLGSGAMGRVYKAYDEENDRVVALKLINEKLAKSEKYQKKLAGEAEATAAIDSPYVVKIWEHSQIDGKHYIALEYVEGKDLRAVLHELEFDNKLDIARQIGMGIKSAHANALIHRDLKPENIKLTSDGRVKILDLGLAKTVSAEEVDDQGDIEGTLYYLSPEQVTGDTLTFNSDLFSYGAILYEMFAGKRAFDGDYPAAIIYSILHEEPEVPSTFYNELPGWCDEMIMRLLDKQPENRYENIQVVLDFIEQSLREKTTVARKARRKETQTLTIIDLKNLSGDESWDYFCVGFTEDLMHEISRRTDLVVSSEPASEHTRNVREIFDKYRSDFAVIGSLMKWKEGIKLNLSVYESHDAEMISGKKYEGGADELFELMEMAVEDIAAILSEVSGAESIDVENYFKTDINAYDYYLKGKNYYQTNRPEDLQIAEQMFEKALEIDSDLALAHSGLSDVYAFQYMAYYDRSQERIEKAREEALKALNINPGLPEGHRSLGRYYMFIGAFNSAENSFKTAIETDPKYAIGYRTLAWLKELADEHENAIFWAKKALKNAPNDLETLLLLGLANMHLAKYTVAMATLQRAIELAPDYGRAHYNLGRIYVKLGVRDKALENFEQAIRFKGDPNAFIDSAYIYMIKNEHDMARQRFKESIRADYFPFIAFYFLGQLENQIGNEDEAIKYFKDAEKSSAEYELNDQANPHLKAYRAMALTALGEKEKAFEILEKLKDSESYDGEALYNIARVYSMLNQREKANKLLEEAIKKHPGPTINEIQMDPHFKYINISFEEDEN
jgi:serine/threonine protein kinase/Tfp pilus assembly protein PilF